MTILPLGGASEVGRSCHLIKFRGRNILLDCGLHPGRNGVDSLPFLDSIDVSTVDLCLVSHFHIDHVAGLPYLTEKTGFQGKVYMTHATKAVSRVLLSDSIRLTPDDDEAPLYDEEDLARCVDNVEVIDFHQIVEDRGFKFWCYNAGHVLGAAMFFLDFGDVRLLYTGDYSLEEDRHLVPAEVPEWSPDVLIMESTYGTQKHEARDVREALFVSTIERVVQRGGKCLLPVFALGRAQELLLILDEYWRERGESQEFKHVPVYYASKLATRALRVYQTYVNMMNSHVQHQLDIANPFKFQYVSNLTSVDDLLMSDKKGDKGSPCVVLASPGMLQSGVSRQLFERWCSDDKNAVVLAGYSVEGTLAKKLMTEPDEITAVDGRTLARKCTVVSVSFSAHTDYKQNYTFVKATSPSSVILVHGERHEMQRFKTKLAQDVAKWPDDKQPTIATPENGQPVNIRFPANASVDVCSPLSKKHKVGPGILVHTDLKMSYYNDDDIPERSPLSVAVIEQHLHLAVPAVVAKLLLPALQQTFVDVHPVAGDLEADPLLRQDIRLRICDVLDCRITSDGIKNHVHLSWNATPFADVVADAVACLALHSNFAMDSSFSSLCCEPSPFPPPDDVVKVKTEDSSHGGVVINLVRSTLADHFGPDRLTELDLIPAPEVPVKPEPDDDDKRDVTMDEAPPAASDEDAAEKTTIKQEPPEDQLPGGVPLLRVQVDHDDTQAIVTLFQHADQGRFRVDVASDDDSLRHRLERHLLRLLDATTPIETSPSSSTVRK